MSKRRNVGALLLFVTLMKLIIVIWLPRSWRTGDIVKTYTLRWLVEVVIEDLKVHEGWGQATKSS
jgi:hypothetical protein